MNPFRCRACAGASLEGVIALGDTPLANALLREEQLEEPEPRFPLDLVFCRDCSLVQISETVSPEILFRDYLYLSSVSATMLEHARTLVDRMFRERSLGPEHLVIEIASNDGYLLQYYKERGVRVLGIEPAANIAEIAERERGIETLVEFFGAELGTRLRGRANVLHAHNVMAHVPDPGDFMRGLREILDPAGRAVIEAPYVHDLISRNEFDTIYHEHFSYFSLSAVESLARRHGLAVVDVERVPIHGGSLRYFVAHEAERPAASVAAFLDEERSWGVDDPGFYRGFAERVWKLRDELLRLLVELKEQGKSVAAYGASAKGATLLNAFGIGADLIDFVSDLSPAKQGLYTPGTHLPVLPASALLERKPDYVLLLTWNFADEILAQQTAYRDAGGRFIVPIPEVSVV